MKTFLKVIAWIGFGIFSLGLIVCLMTTIGYWVNPPNQYHGGVDFGHPFAIILGLIGIPLMLIGGFIGRPRFFWMGSIIAGALYIIAFVPFIGDMVSKIHEMRYVWRSEIGWIFNNALQELGPMILGVIGIIEGIFIRRIEIKDKSKASI